MANMIYYYMLSAILGALGLTLMFRRRKRMKKTRKYWVRPWIRRRMSSKHHNMLDLYKELLVDGDVTEFRATLRMSPEVYFQLLEKLRSAITLKHSNIREPVSAETRLALTMHYLALGEGYRSVSQQFRVGLSTSRCIVRHTCHAIANVLGPDYIKTPSTNKEWKCIAEDFNEKWHFPHCLGSLDGKHIRIVAPRKSGSFYFNYKEYFSIVLLAVVNADYQFIYLDIGSEGKASDGGIWSKCSLYQHMKDPTNPLGIPAPEVLPGSLHRIPYFLIGDDAFKLDEQMMKPFPGFGLTMKQRIYNYRLSRCRRIVENSFGILACRFQIFRRPIEVEPEFVQEIVYATCILHNYLRSNGRNDYMPATAVDHEGEDGDFVPGTWREETDLIPIKKTSKKNASEYAKSIRTKLSEYFVSKEGQVYWQYDKAIL